MRHQLLSYVRTHAFVIAFLVTIPLGAFASETNSQPEPNSAQHKITQRQSRPRGTCDPHMKKVNGVCRLAGKKLVLSETIVIQPGDLPYDCNDGYILPPSLSDSKDPANDPRRYQAPSSPQIAIFIKDAHDVRITRCKIIGFDFGIFAINGKTSAGSTSINNKFTDNQIIAHYAGISLLSVDNTEVANNDVTLTHLGGRAINVQWDSDNNNLHHNTVTGDFDSSRTGAYAAPAADANGTPLAITSNPLRDPSTNPQLIPQLIFIGQTQGSERPLLTAFVDGITYQFTTDRFAKDPDFPEGNIVEANEFRLNMAGIYDGLSLSLPRGTLVKNNILHADTRAAIRVTSLTGTATIFPGTCSNDASRHCFDATECNLAPAVGSCQTSNSQTAVSDLWTGVDNTIEGNTVYGPFKDMGIGTAGRKTKVIGNSVVVEPGRSAFGPVFTGAIALFADSYGNTTHREWGATVSHNTTSGVWPALSLAIRIKPVSSPDEGFTARIGLNDFLTVYKTENGVRVPNYAVRVVTQPPPNPPDYFIPTDISSNFSETLPLDPKSQTITGNFWGLDCPDLFLSSAVTPSLVLVSNGKMAPGIVVDDSHALNDTVLHTINLLLQPSAGSRCSGLAP